MPDASPFPPAAPSIAGLELTVSLFLNSPPRVQRALEDLTSQRFVTDLVFAGGPTATGGAVIYDQVTENDLFLGRDVQAIAPGAEFPQLTDTERAPLVALARKWGGEMFLTDEEVRRDKRDVLGRRLMRLRNTIVRRVDAVGMAALRAAPLLTTAASADWSTPSTDIIGDLAVPQAMIDALDLPYVLDTALVNPAQALDLRKDKDIRDAFSNAGETSLIRTGYVGRLMGFDFVTSNQVQAGEVIFLQRKVVGSVSDEVPMYAKPIPDERRERTYIHGARVVVPYVTDPKAAVRVTGA